MVIAAILAGVVIYSARTEGARQVRVQDSVRRLREGRRALENKNREGGSDETTGNPTDVPAAAPNNDEASKSTDESGGKAASDAAKEPFH
jgi:type II secretory pathway pseudopilin PulG